jgi:hypothetical protein
MAIQAPQKGDPLMLEAEFDEGSPIKIVIANGKESAPMGIRQLKLVHRNTYRVKAFMRHTKAGEVRVPAHDRRMPYRKLRAVHKSI